MLQKTQFYIDGQWVDPQVAKQVELINPATEQAYGVVSYGAASDVDLAVEAARKAFGHYRHTSLDERLTWLKNLAAIYERRYEEMAQTISLEMGAPITMAREEHAASGQWHLNNIIQELPNFPFEHPLYPDMPEQRVRHEPIGVCGLITPWNWPINQLMLKIAPALAVGCTVVLKPSEVAPLSALLLAEMMDEAGFPTGVFNLVNGDGLNVGSAMSKHVDVQMMSFTGSTGAGIAVMKDAADTVKKVTLELGGKSPNVVFADADLETVVAAGVANCFCNVGQTCVAPTRMLVERSAYDQVVALATEAANNTLVDDPSKEWAHLGPLSSKAQFDKVQSMIQMAMDEGAHLVAGGLGRPEGLETGYFARPTVFADVRNDMRIAQEEVFGPVLTIIPFDTESQAIEMANDTPYGLNARVQSGDMERARRVASQLDAGMVQINGVSPVAGIPFGGFKQSGIGREGGRWGLEDYCEVKIVSGW